VKPIRLTILYPHYFIGPPEFALGDNTIISEKIARFGDNVIADALNLDLALHDLSRTR